MRLEFSSESESRRFEYRPAIDGLRGIAVLAVLGFHAFSNYVPGGFVGVDVFFVISGFLITGIILNQLRRGRFSFAEFYARRIRRLFPALGLVLTVTLVVGLVVLLPDEMQLLGKHIAAAALFVANIAFWRESGYFDVQAEFKPLLHLWSLGIEEQFYLLWPAFLVLLGRHYRVLLVVLGVLVLISFSASVILATEAPVAGFYLPVSRFWELGLGCLLAIWQARGAPRLSPHGFSARALTCNLAPIVGLTLILVAVFLFDGDQPFPGWRALIPSVGAMLIIVTSDDAWVQRRLLAAPPLVYMGLISYALYLWHWPLLAFANILQSGPLPYPMRWVLLLLGFAFAVLTYHFVELPIRRRKRIRVNVALIAGSAFACVCGLGAYWMAGWPARYEVDTAVLNHGPRVDELCTRRIGAPSRINYCRTTSARPPDVLVMGDSRAQAIYEAIAPALPGYSTMLLGRGGCPPVLDVRIRGYDLNEEDCEAVWREFVDYVQEARPKVIVLVGNGSFLLTDPRIQLSSTTAPVLATKEELYERGLEKLLAELTRTSQVTHIAEFPTYKTSPACFLRRVSLPGSDCSPHVHRAAVERAMSQYQQVLARIERRFPDVRFVESIPFLCSATVCSQHQQGQQILYSDAKHLSPTGARLLVALAGIPSSIAEDVSVGR